MAQLVARFHGMEEVTSSNLVSSTLEQKSLWLGYSPGSRGDFRVLAPGAVWEVPGRRTPCEVKPKT